MKLLKSSFVSVKSEKFSFQRSLSALGQNPPIRKLTEPIFSGK